MFDILPPEILSEARISLTLSETERLIQRYVSPSFGPGIDPAAEFPSRLRILRLYNNLTTRALGEQVGVVSSTIRHWENGSNRPLFRYIVALAKALNVPQATLFPQVVLSPENSSQSLPETLHSNAITQQIKIDPDINLDTFLDGEQ